MGPVVEEILMLAVKFLIKEVLTPENVKGLEKDLADLLHSAASKVSNHILASLLNGIADAIEASISLEAAKVASEPEASV